MRRPRSCSICFPDSRVGCSTCATSWPAGSATSIATAATAEIDRGIAAVDTALYGVPSARPHTPFFRFPGFASTPVLLDRLAERGIAVFGADLWASDWNPMTPQHELRLVMERLEANHGGIVLFHDTKRQTAAMLPAFLHNLKATGYRVVHIVADAGKRSQSEHALSTKNSTYWLVIETY